MRLLLAAILLTLVGAGCAALMAQTQQVQQPSPLAPVWSGSELEDHLQVFSSREADGRATGTSGYVRVAAYVAARMAEFRLQPVLDAEYRVVYPASINYPMSAVLATAAPDSMPLLSGYDFLPHGLTDSGRVVIHELVVRPAPEAVRPGDGVLLAQGTATPERLRALRDAGAAAAFVVGGLLPRLRPAPVERLLAAQLTGEALDRILHAPPTPSPPDTSASPRTILSQEGRRFVLPRPLHYRVASRYEPGAGALNVMGYVAGEHPERARDLVLVGADLDAAGHFAGVQTLEFEHIGIGAAALLEVARNVSYLSRHWTMPARTVLFAVFSGARLGHTGLRAYLRAPTWELDRLRAVVYLGLDEADRAAVEELLAPYGVPLHVVALPEAPLHDEPAVLLPDAAGRRAQRDLGRPLPPASDVDLEAVLELAVTRAEALADEAFPVVLRESLSGLPVTLSLPDTLRVPPGFTP